MIKAGQVYKTNQGRRHKILSIKNGFVTTLVTDYKESHKMELTYGFADWLLNYSYTLQPATRRSGLLKLL